jgi:hypothetical protein
VHVFFIFGVQGTPAAVAVVVLVEEVVFVVVGDGLLLPVCSEEVPIDTRFMLTFCFACKFCFAFEFAHAFFLLVRRALSLRLLTLPTGE